VYVGKARKLLQWQEQELSKRLGLSDAEPLVALEDNLLDPAFAAEVRKRPDMAALASALQRAVGATLSTTSWLYGKSVAVCKSPCLCDHVNLNVNVCLCSALRPVPSRASLQEPV
jgi:hypothetical protein